MVAMGTHFNKASYAHQTQAAEQGLGSRMTDNSNHGLPQNLAWSPGLGLAPYSQGVTRGKEVIHCND